MYMCVYTYVYIYIYVYTYFMFLWNSSHNPSPNPSHIRSTPRTPHCDPLWPPPRLSKPGLPIPQATQVQDKPDAWQPLDSLRRLSVKIGTMQNVLAWPPRKDDAQTEKCNKIMDLGIPPLNKFKVLLESNPLRSRILVRRLNWP